MTSIPTLPMKALPMLLRCRRTLVVLALLGMAGGVSAQVTIFTENMGTGTAGTTTIAASTFQNSGTYTYSGTADTRITLPSSVYTGASGGRNVFLVGTAGKYFQMDGIVTTGYTNLSLSFGAFKSTNGSNLTPLLVAYSTDGSTWNTLTFPAQPTGSGTSNWRLVTITGGTIPATANLRLRWTNSTAAADYRIDDITLTGISVGPTVNFLSTADTVAENIGTDTVKMTISPAATTNDSVTIHFVNGSGCVYGSDYTTTPAAVADSIVVNIVPGDTVVYFVINVIDDAVPEAAETISYTITGSSSGIALGSGLQHVTTIMDNDSPPPTVQFITNDTLVDENTAGTKTYRIIFDPIAHLAGDLTVQVTDVGTTYGAGAGGDYTTNPAPVANTITLHFGAATTVADTLTFTVTVTPDGTVESTESVEFTLSGVPAGFGIASDDTRTLTIVDDDSPSTVLEPGDIMVVGFSPNTDCAGGDDQISFFCFKDIQTGTEIDLTDCGYGGCFPGQFKTTEGFVALTRTGGAIPAGQVITFHIDGSGVVTFVAPDTEWSYSNLNSNGVNLSTAGDPFFFMQGSSTWDGSSASTSYDGTLLLGVTFKLASDWGSSCNPNSSELPQSLTCLNIKLLFSKSYYKYTGLITSATQHDWILRIENASNWTTTFGDCNEFQTTPSGYDWITDHPILPITPSIPGNLWNGALSTDWFNCSNWDLFYVPDSSTDVTINETAANDCVVGLTGTNAVCASVLLTSATSATPKLTVNTNKTLVVDGPVTISRTGGFGDVELRVVNYAHLSATDLLLQSVNGSNDEAQLTCVDYMASTTFTGNVTLGQGGFINLAGSIPYCAMYIGGNYTNERDETKFNDWPSIVTFNGTGDQTISIATGEERFDNLNIHKPSGKVILNSPIRIHSSLDLTNGVIMDTVPGSLVSFEYTGGVLNANNNSYVNGPVQVFGHSSYAFTFPIGKSGHYRPCRLDNNTATATDAFTAEYFKANPEDPVGHLVQPTTLDHISHAEYWTIEQSVGTPSARVILSWDTATSQGVDVLADLRVAHWDADSSNWLDRGEADVDPSGPGGFIAEDFIENSFSPWTLASVTHNDPLPIELLSFTAVPRNGEVELAWSTASEQNNDHFTVERSADAEHFEEVLRESGAGNSQQVLHYAATDHAPLAGHSYYRLRQTDYDGSSALSATVPVLLQGGAEITVLYNDGRPWLRDLFPTGSLLEVRDGTGRLVAQDVIRDSGLQAIPVDGLAHGVYVLRLSDGAHVASTRFVY